MRLIIDIPEEMYKTAKDGMWCGNHTIGQAIANAKVFEQVREEIEQLWKKEPCAIKHGCLDEVLEIIDRHLNEVGE